VHQMNGESQCLDEVVNQYREKCMDTLSILERVGICHVPQEDNVRANTLAQHASSYDVQRDKFEVKQWPISHTILAIQKDDDESLMLVNR
jgi:hypothetical protein